MTEQQNLTTKSTSITDFDLDVSIVTSGMVIPDLLKSTDDNCTTTCQSACSNSGC